MLVHIVQRLPDSGGQAQLHLIQKQQKCCQKIPNAGFHCFLGFCVGDICQQGMQALLLRGKPLLLYMNTNRQKQVQQHKQIGLQRLRHNMKPVCLVHAVPQLRSRLLKTVRFQGTPDARLPAGEIRQRVGALYLGSIVLLTGRRFVDLIQKRAQIHTMPAKPVKAECNRKIQIFLKVILKQADQLDGFHLLEFRH